nr:phospholipase D family protein [Roseomonas acroporae]
MLLREVGARTAATLVPGGLEAFALRAEAARAATRSLDLLYYAWHDDITGRLLAHEVLQAAERGVRVRLLLDDSYVLGDGSPVAVLAAHPRIEIRLFNAARWQAWGKLGFLLEFALGGWHLNHRMHNKAWIADDRLVITGGRNIGDEYFDASGEFNFRDLDLAVVGEAVQQAVGVFRRYWNNRLARRLQDTRGAPACEPTALPAWGEALRHHAASAAAAPYLARLEACFGEGGDRRPDAADCAAWCGENGLLPADGVRILADPPEKATGRRIRGGLAPAILAALESARREALLISPYFVPGEKGLALLLDLRRRGVRVSVVTNSLAATDVVAVHAGYARYRKALLAGGVELYELKRSGREDGGVFGSRGASLHTKALSVDGELVFVGSFNLDPRSANLNTEMGAFARNRELAARLAVEHARLVDPYRSYRVRLAGGRLRWVDRSANGVRVQRHEPDASFRRRALAWLVRWLPVESQL